MTLDTRKASVWADMQDLASRASQRTLTTNEIAQFDAMEREYQALGSDDVGARAAALARESDDAAVGNTVVNYRGNGRSEGSPGDIVTLRPEQRMASLVRDDEASRGLTMSRYVKAIVTGDWSGIPIEARAMSVGTAGAGGYVVPDALSARVIDRARNQARVLQAGATTVPMDTGTMKLARVAATGGDPTAAWKLENASATASDMTLEQVTLTARTLVAIVKSSIELIEDSDVESTIETALASSLAVELDRAALRGTGTNPEPRGVRNTTNVGIQSMGTNGLAFTSYDPISTAVQTIQAANGDPNAVIYSPRTAGSLDRLKDTTNQPLRPPPSVDGLRRLVTAQIPENLTQGAATTASEAYVGQWDELLIGVRRNLVIEASREAADTSESAFRNLQVWIRAYLRADIAIAQPSHFVVITGVL
ncbi:MAG: phage major capsid protein [Chloroflexi bacterium]|nr:phage major capsid protein [Chloroflexota bacterium]